MLTIDLLARRLRRCMSGDSVSPTLQLGGYARTPWPNMKHSLVDLAVMILILKYSYLFVYILSISSCYLYNVALWPNCRVSRSPNKLLPWIR